MRRHGIARVGVLASLIVASVVLAAPVSAARAQLSLDCAESGGPGTIATIWYPAGTATITFSYVIDSILTNSGQDVPRPAKAGSASVTNGTFDTVTSLTVEGFSPSGNSLGSDSCTY